MSLLNNILPKKAEQEFFLVLSFEEHKIFAGVAKIFEDKISIIGTGECDWSLKENEIEAVDLAVSTAEKNLSEDILIEKVIFGLPVMSLENDQVKPEYLSKLKKICKELSLNPSGFIEHTQALAYYLEKQEESPPTTFLIYVTQNSLTFTLLRVGKIERHYTIERSASILTDLENTLSLFQEEILPSRIILYDEGDNEKMEDFREELLSFPWNKHPSFLHTPKIEILPSNALITALIETVGGSKLKDLQIEKTQEGIHEPIPVTDESFGFVKDKDIGIEKTKEVNSVPSALSGGKLVSFLKSLRLPALTWSPEFIKPWLIGVLACIVLVLGGLLLFWYYPKATVNLIVYPITSSQKLNAVFASDASAVQSEKNVIQTSLISTDIKGDKSAKTTGKNKIGEAAKGEVIVYNKTTASKTFTKGTVITNGSLRFSLDAEVNIASASDTGEGLVFGKTASKITAGEIGPEGNLTPGSIFTFKDYPQSSFYAKNNQALTGGTSRDISSVSKEDQDQLLSSLTDELSAKAQQDLSGKLSGGYKILDGSPDKSINSKKFTAEVGSEAKDLSLSLDLKVSASSYKESDLADLAQSDSLPPRPGFKEDPSRKNIETGDVVKDKKTGLVKTSAVVTYFFIPDIDLEKIKSEIKGRTWQEAVDILKQSDNIGGVEIIGSDIPLLGQRLPWRSGNITVSVTPG